MKTKRFLSLFVLIVLVLGLVAGSVGFFGNAQTAQAASSYPIIVNTAGIAASGVVGGSSYNWSTGETAYTSAEVWYSIDQGTTNTITLRLDASPDGTIWKTGHTTVVSANAADATSYTTSTIAGRYFRIYATVVNTNTVTPTIKVVLR